MNRKYINHARLIMAPVIILLLSVSILVSVWGIVMIRFAIEAERDADAFFAGQIDRVAWVQYSQTDTFITRESSEAGLFNRAVSYFNEYTRGEAREKGYPRYITRTILEEAYVEATASDNREVLVSTAFALATLYFELAIENQDAQMLDAAEGLYMTVLRLDPTHMDTKWNLELLLKMKASGEGPTDGDGNGDDEGPTGPGGIEVGQGGY